MDIFLARLICNPFPSLCGPLSAALSPRRPCSGGSSRYVYREKLRVSCATPGLPDRVRRQEAGLRSSHGNSTLATVVGRPPGDRRPSSDGRSTSLPDNQPSIVCRVTKRCAAAERRVQRSPEGRSSASATSPSGRPEDSRESCRRFPHSSPDCCLLLAVSTFGRRERFRSRAI